MPKPILIGGEPYHVVLVPSAPVPVGGALIYVPAAWVKPANIGVETLMSIYVSMGVTSPQIVETDLGRVLHRHQDRMFQEPSSGDVIPDKPNHNS
jgi:uncharacterized membrane protein